MFLIHLSNSHIAIHYFKAVVTQIYKGIHNDTVGLITALIFQGVQQAAVVLEYVFLVFPNYSLGRALMDISVNHIQNEFDKLIYTGSVTYTCALQYYSIIKVHVHRH